MSDEKKSGIPPAIDGRGTALPAALCKRVLVEVAETLEYHEAEVERLKARLEIAPGFEPYDGIACRDETIRQQDERIYWLRRRLDEARVLLEDARTTSVRTEISAGWHDRCRAFLSRLRQSASNSQKAQSASVNVPDIPLVQEPRTIIHPTPPEDIPFEPPAEWTSSAEEKTDIPPSLDKALKDGARLPQQVIDLVIAAREAWEEHCTFDDALDKALVPFAELVPYENQPADPRENEHPADMAGGWIVGDANGRRWRTWENGFSCWRSDREKATRYARREDAEAVHAEDEEAWRVEPYQKKGPEACASCHHENCGGECLG